jgi:hypothetical protein
MSADTHGGAVAPPPPGKTDAEVTTAVGPLLAASQAVQEAQRMRQAAARQEVIDSLPEDATWLPSQLPAGTEPTSPPSPPAPGRSPAGPPPDAPLTPQAGPASAPAPPSRGASLDGGAASYKDASELLAAPPGGQVRFGGAGREPAQPAFAAPFSGVLSPPPRQKVRPQRPAALSAEPPSIPLPPTDHNRGAPPRDGRGPGARSGGNCGGGWVMSRDGRAPHLRVEAWQGRSEPGGPRACRQPEACYICLVVSADCFE